ncbi:unnamed protein product [Amoebophrya sp. A25]|nr:unnamed protein product [Amoebophrya sp. A25]|eukprot:GSA25T00008714001.1
MSMSTALGGGSSSSILKKTGSKVIEDPMAVIVKRQRDTWLRYHGKAEQMDFSVEERRKLKGYYEALTNGAESIGLAEIEDFFIAFGLVESRQQLLRIFPKGSIDSFSDFLQLLSCTNHGSRATEDNRKRMLWIMKNMMSGTLGDEELSFTSRVSSYRRKMLLDALMSKPGTLEQLRGSRIMQGYSRQLITNAPKKGTQNSRS